MLGLSLLPLGRAAVYCMVPLCAEGVDSHCMRSNMLCLQPHQHPMPCMPGPMAPAATNLLQASMIAMCA